MVHLTIDDLIGIERLALLDINNPDNIVIEGWDDPRGPQDTVSAAFIKRKHVRIAHDLLLFAATELHNRRKLRDQQRHQQKSKVRAS